MSIIYSVLTYGQSYEDVGRYGECRVGIWQVRDALQLFIVVSVVYVQRPIGQFHPVVYRLEPSYTVALDQHRRAREVLSEVFASYEHLDYRPRVTSVDRACEVAQLALGEREVLVRFVNCPQELTVG